MMDLETENRIAAILLREAAELRRRAEREGVRVYLERPKERIRPNSRFLSATVLGVQQANRAVEADEMWRVRQKELELDDRLEGRSRHVSNGSKNLNDVDNSHRSTSQRHAVNDCSSAPSSSRKRAFENYSHSGEDEGLRDEEIEEFLHSRVKRGRGSVGSRMDETGPYLLPSPDSDVKLSMSQKERLPHVVLGPERPPSLKSFDSSEEDLAEERQSKSKKVNSRRSDKKHSKKQSKKHRSKDKSRDKKRKDKSRDKKGKRRDY